MLDLVWMDKEPMAMRLAAESEWSRVMAHRLDDFQKLMSIKSPLKLFIYATRNLNESDEVREKLADYLLRFSQHLEGEEYLLMEVMKGRPGFYHYLVPNSGSVSDVAFTPLQLGLRFSA